MQNKIFISFDGVQCICRLQTFTQVFENDTHLVYQGTCTRLNRGEVFNYRICGVAMLRRANRINWRLHEPEQVIGHDTIVQATVYAPGHWIGRDIKENHYYGVGLLAARCRWQQVLSDPFIF